MQYVSFSGFVNATDVSLKQVVDLEAEAVKRIGPGRSDIDREVDLEIWTWYQDQQTVGSKPSWHEVRVYCMLCFGQDIAYSSHRKSICS
jgi:hypothetical protein